jgi:hypothetical protein
MTTTAASPRDQLTISWCPTCEQECLPIKGRCGFCDTFAKPLKPKTSGKKRGTPPKIPEADLRTLHALHTKGERVSANLLARKVYERYGFASARSCHNGICHGWETLGLKARDRIEMTVERETRARVEGVDESLSEIESLDAYIEAQGIDAAMAERMRERTRQYTQEVGA